MKRARLIPLSALAMLAATAPAFAHPGVAGHTHGFLQSVDGSGHILAMATLGLLAARLGWLALWRVAAVVRAARR